MTAFVASGVLHAEQRLTVVLHLNIAHHLHMNIYSEYPSEYTVACCSYLDTNPCPAQVVVAS